MVMRNVLSFLYIGSICFSGALMCEGETLSHVSVEARDLHLRRLSEPLFSTRVQHALEARVQQVRSVNEYPQVMCCEDITIIEAGCFLVGIVSCFVGFGVESIPTTLAGSAAVCAGGLHICARGCWSFYQKGSSRQTAPARSVRMD